MSPELAFLIASPFVTGIFVLLIVYMIRLHIRIEEGAGSGNCDNRNISRMMIWSTIFPVEAYTYNPSAHDASYGYDYEIESTSITTTAAVLPRLSTNSATADSDSVTLPDYASVVDINMDNESIDTQICAEVIINNPGDDDALPSYEESLEKHIKV